MSSPASLEIGSGASGCPLLLAGLPWCVVLGAFVSVVPIALFSDGLFVLVHLPTFVALLEPAVAISCRARDGQPVSPIGVAAVVGGLVASVALMLIPVTVVPMGREYGWVYAFTWIVLPVLGLAGSTLAAGLTGALVGLAWLGRRWSRSVSESSAPAGGSNQGGCRGRNANADKHTMRLM